MRIHNEPKKDGRLPQVRVNKVKLLKFTNICEREGLTVSTVIRDFIDKVNCGEIVFKAGTSFDKVIEKHGDELTTICVPEILPAVKPSTKNWGPSVETMKRWDKISDDFSKNYYKEIDDWLKSCLKKLIDRPINFDTLSKTKYIELAEELKKQGIRLYVIEDPELSHSGYLRQFIILKNGDLKFCKYF